MAKFWANCYLFLENRPLSNSPNSLGMTPNPTGLTPMLKCAQHKLNDSRLRSTAAYYDEK